MIGEVSEVPMLTIDPTIDPSMPYLGNSCDLQHCDVACTGSSISFPPPLGICTSGIRLVCLPSTPSNWAPLHFVVIHRTA